METLVNTQITILFILHSLITKTKGDKEIDAVSYVVGYEQNNTLCKIISKESFINEINNLKKLGYNTKIYTSKKTKVIILNDKYLKVNSDNEETDDLMDIPIGTIEQFLGPGTMIKEKSEL